MSREKTIVILLIPMLLIFTAFNIRCEGVTRNTPAAEKGAPEYYNRSAGSIERFEDLFFPHHFTRNISKEIDVEGHWRNDSFINCKVLDEEFRDFKQPPDYKKEDLPPDYKPANLTLIDDNGRMIYSFDNTGLKIGSMGTARFDLNNSDTLTLNSTGGFSFFISSNDTWENPFTDPEHIDFIGQVRTFNLWGYKQEISEFDQENKYVRVKIKSDRPIRGYIFESMEGELVDYDESLSREVTLEIKDETNPFWVGDSPFLTLSSPVFTAINATFIFEVCDYPLEWWVLPSIIGVFTGIILVLFIWYKWQS